MHTINNNNWSTWDFMDMYLLWKWDLKTGCRPVQRIYNLLRKHRNDTSELADKLYMAVTNNWFFLQTIPLKTALEVRHRVDLGECQKDSDRALCASASFSQALHTHKNCSMLVLEKVNLFCISKERGRNLKPRCFWWQEEEIISLRVFK